MLGLSPCFGPFPCFRLNMYFFVLFKHVPQWTLGIPSVFSISDSKGVRWSGGYFCCNTDGYVQANCPPQTARRDLRLAMGNWHPLLKLILLSLILLCDWRIVQSSACLVVFSLATPVPRCNGQKYWTSPNNRQQMPPDHKNYSQTKLQDQMASPVDYTKCFKKN